MPIFKSFFVIALVTTLLPTLAARAQEDIPADLQTVVVEPSEVETHLGEITAIGVPEEVAQRAFNDIVALGAVATPELVDIYRDGDEPDHRRWVAARALGHIGGKDATQALLDGLGEADFLSRIGAVSALGVLKTDKARMALEEAMFDSSMEVRCTAADGLAEIGHAASSLPLTRSLNSPESFHRGGSLPVRGHIVLALGRTGGETAIEALVGVLDDSDDSLRALTVKALEEATGANPTGQIGDGRTTTPSQVQGWKDWWAGHAEARGLQ